MNLLAGTCYDPGVAVVKTTGSGSGLAILAFDTTNLRLAFTVPPSGFARVRLASVIHGATTFPSVLFAVMSGAGVVKRMAPIQSLGNTAVATAMVSIESDFIVAGLTAGESRTWDAAYGVETGVVNSAIKYGGPNDGSPANNAFGGFAFEIWDPCPFYTPASGVPPTSPVIAYTSGIKTKTDFLPSATAGAAGGVQIAGTNAATVYASLSAPSFLIGGVSNIAQTGDSFARIGVAGAGLTAIDLPDQTMSITGNITGNLSGSVGSVTGAVGSVTGAVGSVTGNVSGNVLGVVASVSGLAVANLDAAVTSRMASYTQPTGFLAATFPAGTVANTTNITAGTITTVGGNVTGSVGSVVGLTASNLDATVSSRLADASYTAPDNAAIAAAVTGTTTILVDTAAIKAKTNSLTFTIAGQVDSNAKSMNDSTIVGNGTASDLWRG